MKSQDKSWSGTPGFHPKVRAYESVHNLNDWARGFNHLILLYEGKDEEVIIEGFEMKAVQNRLETGIEY